MSELIVTCAGCGKRYKGIHSAKRFRCAACENIFTFPDSPRIPQDDTKLCTNCWTGYRASQLVEACQICSQKMSPQVFGQALITASVSALRPATASGHFQSVSSHGSSDNDDNDDEDDAEIEYDELKAQIVDLKSRQTLIQCAQIKLGEERDAATSARDALQEKIVELKTRLSVAAESAEQSRSDVEHAVTSRQAAEALILEHEIRLRAALDAQAAAAKERDEATGARHFSEARLAEFDAHMKAQQEILSQARTDRDEARGQQRLAENKTVELQTRLDTAREAEEKAAAERAQLANERREIENRFGELNGRLAAEQDALSTAHRERDAANAARENGDARLSELQQTALSAQKAQMTLQIERDNSIELLQDERRKLTETQEHLRHFQELAATALGPLGTEYSRVAKELIEQSEALFKLSLQTQEELDQRRTQIRALAASLKGQLDSTCREFVGRLAQASPDEPVPHEHDGDLQEISAPAPAGRAQKKEPPVLETRVMPAESAESSDTLPIIADEPVPHDAESVSV